MEIILIFILYILHVRRLVCALFVFGILFCFLPSFFWLFSFGRPLFFYQIYLSSVCFGWWRILFLPIFIAAGRVLEWASMWRCVYHARFNIYFVDKFVNSPVGYWKKGMTEDRDIITRTPHTYIHIVRSWFTHQRSHCLPCRICFNFFLSIYILYLLFFCTLSLSLVQCSTIIPRSSFVRSVLNGVVCSLTRLVWWDSVYQHHQFQCNVKIASLTQYSNKLQTKKRL